MRTIGKEGVHSAVGQERGGGREEGHRTGVERAGGRCLDGKPDSLVTLHQRFLNHTARFIQPWHQQNPRGDVCLDSREYSSVFHKEVGKFFF